MRSPPPAGPVPELRVREDEVLEKLLSGRLAVFLDYDGTLTPIVADPEQAMLPPGTRALLEDLSRDCVVGVISGRDLDDLRGRVGLDSLWYAGSHGFDLAGPNGWREEIGAGREAVPLLDAAELELRDALAAIAGAAVERKRFSIAVHYRNAAPRDAASVEAAVDAALSGRSGLRKAFGKKVFELRPSADWDKGRALLRLLERMNLEGPDCVVLFAGDDVTDEDAFRVLRERRLGVGVLIGEGGHPDSWASARLEDPDDLSRFLKRLRRRLRAA